MCYFAKNPKKLKYFCSLCVSQLYYQLSLMERVKQTDHPQLASDSLVKLQSYNNHPAPLQQMQLLRLRNGSKCQNIRQVSRQEFFNTKKNQTRMKNSLCFSEPMEARECQDSDSSLFSVANEHNSAPSNKDLDSTFAEEVAVAFKVKQPKRKLNANMRNEASKREDSISEVRKLHLSPQPTLKLRSRQKRPSSNSLTRQRPNTQRAGLKKEWKISDFVLLSKVGEGTYCQVFKAVEKGSGFLCALKIMNKQRMKELEVEQNIKRQLKISLFADHPNLAKLYSFFWDKEHIYLVSQFATDKNLFEYLYQPKIKLKKGLKSEEAANFTRQICSAIAYLHRHFVIHRDLKPQNILITMFNNIKICDLGWSVYNPNKALRSTFCGTPLYLAPQLISQNQYDESIDIWAIGVITYEMLTEEIPFKIERANDLRKILFEEVTFERIRNKLAADFIERAMRKDSSKRVMISQLLHHPFAN